MQQLQVLLKAVLLRRTKSSKIDGEPILRLPPRVTEEVHAVFSDDEQELYTALESKTQLQFNKYLRAGTIGRNYSNILVLLLRLRQACCHPHLMSDFSVDISASTGEIDMIVNAKSFSGDVVLRLKENEPLECPVCIDAVENPIIFFPCGHSTCAECFARISDPALAVQQGNDGSVDVKCPNCRAKVDPKKVTDNASFRKVHYPDETTQPGGDGLSGAVDHVNGDDDDEDEDEDARDSDQDSLADFIVSDGDVDDDIGDVDSPRPSSATAKKGKKSKSKGKGPRQPTKTLAELKKDAMKNAKAKRKYLNRLQKTWVTSAKVDRAMELLQTIHDGPDGEKTIIFSQFTSLLDLLEVPIMRKGWDYRRYDGSMRPVDRNNSVTDFSDDPRCKIMLVSLKAGNSGLNLVAASHVIIFDPFWNPYIEEQAIDRAHRIGQMRPVHVHRILVKKTVEDRILALQEKKRELIEGALDEKAGKQVSRLGTRELAYLFVRTILLPPFGSSLIANVVLGALRVLRISVSTSLHLRTALSRVVSFLPFAMGEGGWCLDSIGFCLY
jgi:SNF2 family DNA or RNA helicase